MSHPDSAGAWRAKAVRYGRTYPSRDDEVMIEKDRNEEDRVMSEGPYFTPAAELASRVRRRDMSPVELVEAFLRRIEERNGAINAYVAVFGDEAREKAREAERAVGTGRPLGALHGVPIAIKDLVELKAGTKTSFGSVPLKDFVAPVTSTYIERLEDAGAIVLGKTNAPEFGFRATTDNLLFGPTSTPFAPPEDGRPGKNAGGSSGGSAAAVADGLTPIAQGGDSGGSIRVPAAWTNTYGLKPTFGRVPNAVRPNAFLLHSPFVHPGPIARTVEDAALALSVMAGHHPRDPFSLPDEAGADYVGATLRSIEGMRIAYSPNFGVFPVDPSVRAVVERAAGAFEEAGGRVEQVEVGIKRHHDELRGVWVRQQAVMFADTVATFEGYGLDLLKDHRDEMAPQLVEAIEFVRAGYGIADYKLDDAVRAEVLDAMEDVFAGYDLLLTPTVAVPPVDNAPENGATVGPSEVDGEAVDPLLGWTLTYPVNFTGHPAASVPAGLVDGLPVGMQLVGRRYADEAVLAASAAFERARPWHDAYPGKGSRRIKTSSAPQTCSQTLRSMAVATMSGTSRRRLAGCARMPVLSA